MVACRGACSIRKRMRRACGCAEGVLNVKAMGVVGESGSTVGEDMLYLRAMEMDEAMFCDVVRRHCEREVGTCCQSAQRKCAGSSSTGKARGLAELEPEGARACGVAGGEDGGGCDAAVDGEGDRTLVVRGSDADELGCLCDRIVRA